MCSYKLVRAKFEVWGLQTKVEQWTHAVRDIYIPHLFKLRRPVLRPNFEGYHNKNSSEYMYRNFIDI